MKFVKVEWSGEGYWLDPSAYLAELPKLKEEMPRGAAQYATSDGHYDFSSSRCVKDLWLADMSTVHSDEIDLEIKFDPSKWKHDAGLVIRYTMVRKLDIVVGEHVSGLTLLGNVLLDEILPVKDGCSHEIALLGGRLYIECADLQATWGDS